MSRRLKSIGSSPGSDHPACSWRREREHGTDRYRLGLRNEKRPLDVLDFEIDAAIPISNFTQVAAGRLHVAARSSWRGVQTYDITVRLARNFDGDRR